MERKLNLNIANIHSVLEHKVYKAQIPTLPQPTQQKIQLMVDSKSLDELTKALMKAMDVTYIQEEAVKAAGLTIKKKSNSTTNTNGKSIPPPSPVVKKTQRQQPNTNKTLSTTDGVNKSIQKTTTLQQKQVTVQKQMSTVTKDTETNESATTTTTTTVKTINKIQSNQPSSIAPPKKKNKLVIPTISNPEALPTPPPLNTIAKKIVREKEEQRQQFIEQEEEGQSQLPLQTEEIHKLNGVKTSTATTKTKLSEEINARMKKTQETFKKPLTKKPDAVVTTESITKTTQLTSPQTKVKTHVQKQHHEVIDVEENTEDVTEEDKLLQEMEMDDEEQDKIQRRELVKRKRMIQDEDTEPPIENGKEEEEEKPTVVEEMDSNKQVVQNETPDKGKTNNSQVEKQQHHQKQPLLDRYRSYITDVLMKYLDKSWVEERQKILTDNDNNKKKNDRLVQMIRLETEGVQSIKTQRVSLAEIIHSYITKKMKSTKVNVKDSYKRLLDILVMTMKAGGVMSFDFTKLIGQQKACYITGAITLKDKTYNIKMQLAKPVEELPLELDDEGNVSIIVSEEWAVFIQNWVLLTDVDKFAMGEFEEWIEKVNKINPNINKDKPREAIKAFLSDNRGENLNMLYGKSASVFTYFRNWISADKVILTIFENKIEPEWIQNTTQ